MAQTKTRSSSQGAAALLRKASQQLKKDQKELTGENRIFDILTYIESPWGLAMDGKDGHAKLFPGQKFLVKLYYGIELDDFLPENPRDRIVISDPWTGQSRYIFSETEFLEYLYNEGRCNLKEQDHVRRELILSIGRRAGKTTLSGIFASYEVYRLLNLYNPQEYYGLPNGNRIQIISIATDKDQAGLLFNEVTTHLAKCDYFQPYIASNTQSRVDFRTPYDIDKFGTSYRNADGKYSSLNGKATVRVTFKTCNARGLRGSGNIVIILDEVAHFLEKGGTSADQVFNAVSPAAAAFSKKDPHTGLPLVDPLTGNQAPVESRVIMISSPMGKSGLFWNKFNLALQGGEGAENILAIQAPTWEINPTVPLSYYREKYAENPTSFFVEFGAQFSDQTTGWIERKEDLTVCIRPHLRPKTRSNRSRYPHQIGIDVGLVDDGTAVAVTHIDEDFIVLDYHEVWYAGKSWRETNPHLDTPIVPYCNRLEGETRLDFDEIANWIDKLTLRFSIAEGLFDRWNGIPLEQKLHKKGHHQFRCEFFTRDSTSKIYQATKTLIFDEKLVLYDYPPPENIQREDGLMLGQVRHSPLISELLSLQAHHVSKHIILVEAPKTKEAHDDVSDALVRSVWLSINKMSKQKHSFGRSIPGIHTPYTSSGLTNSRFQMRKAMRHGGLGERTLLQRFRRR